MFDTECYTLATLENLIGVGKKSWAEWHGLEPLLVSLSGRREFIGRLCGEEPLRQIVESRNIVAAA